MRDIVGPNGHPLKDPPRLQPGDIVRPHQLGQATANPGHTLVAMFLGACREELEPDVPAYLRSVGFARIHVFEVTLYWREGEEEYSSSLLTTAETPMESVRGAVRWARFASRNATGSPAELRGLTVALMRLGPVGPEGKPHNGRGRTFASWSAESGLTLESLLDAEKLPQDTEAPKGD